jgi:hypothetical protein
MWVRGEIVSWQGDLGFVRERGCAGQDVFLHRNNVTRGEPRAGALVIFETEISGWRGRKRAVNVEIVS